MAQVPICGEPNISYTSAFTNMMAAPLGCLARKWQGLAQPWSRKIGRYCTLAGDVSYEEARRPNDSCGTCRQCPRLSVGSKPSLGQCCGFKSNTTRLRRDGRHASRCTVPWVRSWLPFLWRELAPIVVQAAGVCRRAQHGPRSRTVAVASSLVGMAA